MRAITLKMEGEIQQFWYFWSPPIVSFLFICEFLDLDIIWLVNLMNLMISFRDFFIIDFQ